MLKETKDDLKDYRIDYTSIVSYGINIKAKSALEAYQKWLNSEYDEDDVSIAGEDISGEVYIVGRKKTFIHHELDKIIEEME